MRTRSLNPCLVGLLATVSIPVFAAQPKPWWGKEVEASIARVPAKRPAWVSMLRTTKARYRADVAYLIRYMNRADLTLLSPVALSHNVELAEEARAKTPWGASIPHEVFLDAVLPYANVTEPRDSMRADFLARYLPLVATCKSPGEAALVLNRALFKEYKVGYNTKRLRTDQSPRETIAQGMATCTGLSIMLADACRAVGVPARLAGIHSWPGRGGNHTWVEVWDCGWHFVGAAEPDEKGLDHAWFVDDAAKAVQGVPENAIYAVTYRETGEHWPIAWDPGAHVNGENVTARYASQTVSQPRLMVEVLRSEVRVPTDVVAFDASTGEKVLVGESFGPSQDMNFHLSTPVPAGTICMVVARRGAETALGWAAVDKDTVLRLRLGRQDDRGLSALLRERLGKDPGRKAVARKLLTAIPAEPWALRLLKTAAAVEPPTASNLEEACAAIDKG